MKFLISLIYLSSFCILAQEVEPEDELEPRPDIDATLPEPIIVLSVIQCDAIDAIVRICNEAPDVEVRSDDFVEVFGFTPSELVEAPPKEDVITTPIDDEDFTPSPTPVDRMESELLGKYLMPQNIPYETESNEIKLDQCVDFKFHNRLDDFTDLRQEYFSCEISISASIGTSSGDTIVRNIDLQDIKRETDETR